jgi:hypothetical protein
MPCKVVRSSVVTGYFADQLIVARRFELSVGLIDTIHTELLGFITWTGACYRTNAVYSDKDLVSSI